MLLRRTEKSHDEEQLATHGWTSQGIERQDVRPYKRETARLAELSKISAKMVDLSLQEAQRDPTLRGTVKNRLAPVSSPLGWLFTDVSKIVEAPSENAGRSGAGAPETAVAPATPPNLPRAHGTTDELRFPKFAVLYSWAKIVVREITNYWTSSTSRKRILGVLTSGTQRTVFLIGHWSRILTARAPAVCAVLRKRFGLAKRYRCRDCGREVGVRSRPRNLSERYILPLLLMHPVRCPACFHRDYRLIFTPVGNHSRRYGSSVGNNNRNAA